LSLERVAGIGLAALFIGGCTTKGDVVDLRTEVMAQNEADRAQRDSLISEIQGLRSVLLDSLNVQQRRDITGRVDLQRQIQDLNTALNQLLALTGETQRQLARLESQGPLTLPEEAGGPVTADGQIQVSAEPQALYDAANRQFRRGSYETARGGFDEFLRLFPNDALAPDAQFYRAETFAESDDPDSALTEYARVLELFPNSRRAPTALYKSGQIEAARGNVEAARTFFDRVVQGYPDSDEVELARRELDQLQD
jgi:tol-pal system protein YbgF